MKHIQNIYNQVLKFQFIRFPLYYQILNSILNFSLYFAKEKEKTPTNDTNNYLK